MVCVGYLLLGVDPGLKCSCFPSETLLEKLIIHLQVAIVVV